MNLFVQIIGFLTGVVFCQSCWANPDSLTKNEKKLLEGLIGQVIHDPSGDTYCKVKVSDCTFTNEKRKVEKAGWLSKSDSGLKHVVRLADGFPVVDAKGVAKPDFFTESKEILKQLSAGGALIGPKRGSREVSGQAVGLSYPECDSSRVPVIVRAAWLLRLGNEDLAKQYLDFAKSDWQFEREPKNQKQFENLIVEKIRSEFAWDAYQSGVYEFSLKNDAMALQYMQHLSKKYPKYLSAFGNGKRLLEELVRLNKNANPQNLETKKPSDFNEWDEETKIRWLIDQLENVEVTRVAQPGNVDLSKDWRIQQLVSIGEPAVEQLIDTIDSDQRLIRSIDINRDFIRWRQILSVKEAAFVAVSEILKVRCFDPADDDGGFVRSNELSFKDCGDVVAKLKAYWAKYKGMPFEQRMIKILTDPSSKPKALRESADKLSQSGFENSIEFMSIAQLVDMATDLPNDCPHLHEYKDPTAASSIISAMKSDLNYQKELLNNREEFIPGTGNSKTLSLRYENAVFHYMKALMLVSDSSVLPDIRELFDSTDDIIIKLNLACTAHSLGDSKLIDQMARNFTNGAIKLPNSEINNDPFWGQPRTQMLAAIVTWFSAAKTVECNNALFKLADSDHPAHETAVEAVRTLGIDWTEHAQWFEHPYCITILRKELDNVAPIHVVYAVASDKHMDVTSDNLTKREEIPRVYKHIGLHQKPVQCRRCDQAAEKLCHLVDGLPIYHPILKDSDERLEKMKNILDKPMQTVRPASANELEERGINSKPVFFIE